MNTELLQKMAASEAWEALQNAYGILYCGDGPSVCQEQSLENAEAHLKKCNEWLLALKG